MDDEVLTDDEIAEYMKHGWRWTVVAKDERNMDTGPAELAGDGDLVETIKRLMLLNEATHCEVHEGDVRFSDDDPLDV